MFLPNQSNEEVPLTIAESSPIEVSQDQKLTQENIESLIEPTLVGAMRILRFKNIPTITSSANNKHNQALIGVDFDGLSKANKKLVNQFVKQGFAIFNQSSRSENQRTVDIILNEDKVDLRLPGNRVKSYFTKIADLFEIQDKVITEIKLSEIESVVAKRIGFRDVHHMRENKSAEQIENYISEFKDKYDWSANPLVGIRKED